MKDTLLKARDLSPISDEELVRDWHENEQDLSICKTALAVKINSYGQEYSTQERYETGLKIKKIIEDEVDKRGIEIQ